MEWSLIARSDGTGNSMVKHNDNGALLKETPNIRFGPSLLCKPLLGVTVGLSCFAHSVTTVLLP